MKSITTVLTVTVVSLGVWVFFYIEDMGLTASDTALVVGFCLAAVLLARWIWARIRNRRDKGGKVAKSAKTLAIVSVMSLTVHTPWDGRALLVAASGEQTQNRAARSESALLVTCSPEMPVVQQDGSVVLRVWTAAAEAQTFRYAWVVTAGTINGQGPEVRWDLKGVSSGIYKADVQLEDDAARGGNCSIRVAVIEPQRGTVQRESGRSFLLRGQQEAPGYGLYSYLLLGSHPTEGTRHRYLNTVQAYLGMIDEVTKLEDYVAHAKLNVTYLPLEAAVPENVDATWSLNHYDYARARVLLDVLPGNRKDGIYLVSSLKPLGGNSSPPYLLQDLSTVPTEPPDLISWWMREFLNQAAQERFWEPARAELFVLKLRTTITILAAGLPEVQHALDKWVASVH